MADGWYCIISGGEGSGKSTLIHRLAGVFPEALLTREPGHGDFGQAVRHLLVSGEFELDAWTEYYLFMADRAEHMARTVRPALASRQPVLSDRGWPETFVYQWYAKLGRTDPTPFIQEIRDRGWPMPNLWILLDLDPEIGLRRRGLSGTINAFDRRSLEFHRRVRAGFKLLSTRVPFPIAVLPADQSPDQVFAAARAEIEKL